MTWNERGEVEPTAADLAAIEAEWPLIEADLSVLDAAIRALSAAGGPSPLDWRWLRRAEHRMLSARRPGAARSAVDSESWACQGCGAPMIGRRPADDRCRECPAEPAERAA